MKKIEIERSWINRDEKKKMEKNKTELRNQQRQDSTYRICYIIFALCL